MKPNDSLLNVGLKKLCLTTITIHGDLLWVCKWLVMKHVDIRKMKMHCKYVMIEQLGKGRDTNEKNGI